jgi:hypothetical protein
VEQPAGRVVRPGTPLVYDFGGFPRRFVDELASYRSKHRGRRVGKMTP